MSGSAEKNKRKKFKKEIEKAAHGDANQLMDDLSLLRKENTVMKDLKKENIRLRTRLGTFAIIMGLLALAAIGEGLVILL